ncbi:MAG: DUF2849 domain-containing protein [Myxococcota bacterium]
MKTVTANRLGDGVAVYFTGDGWTERVSEAFVSDDPDALLEKARQDERQNRVVGLYLIELHDEDGELFPKDKKERVRAVGPTVRPDLRREHVSVR